MIESKTMPDTQNDAEHAQEVATGQRYEFGRNWSMFLDFLDEDRIRDAENSLRTFLEVEDLAGKTFLDIGCGSGLFSLAARRLGASVFSFDFDPNSVGCATSLRQRFFPDDKNWKIQEGSVLDREYVQSLGKFDIVYSWGVLHHTGALWTALDNATVPLKKKSQLFIAIYNDQGVSSENWIKIKRFYCSGVFGKTVVRIFFCPKKLLLKVALYETFAFLSDMFGFKNPIGPVTGHNSTRGMAELTDLDDWLGGYPFEPTGLEELFCFYRKRGLELSKLLSVAGGSSNNQLVFRNTGKASADEYEIVKEPREKFYRRGEIDFCVPDEDAIVAAEHMLESYLKRKGLAGEKFLDIGCGDGTLSLAARRLGASVVSFDIDPKAVSHTQALRERFFKDDPNWKIERGSVLDEAYLKTLGRFSIVCAQNVLHFTGDLQRALANAASPLKKNGNLFVTVYNKQRPFFNRFKGMKRHFHSESAGFRKLISKTFLYMVFKFLPYLERYSYTMTVIIDIMEWVARDPEAESALVEDLFEFYKQRGFTLTMVRIARDGAGNNKLVFQKN